MKQGRSENGKDVRGSENRKALDGDHNTMRTMEDGKLPRRLTQVFVAGWGRSFPGQCQPVKPDAAACFPGAPLLRCFVVLTKDEDKKARERSFEISDIHG